MPSALETATLGGGCFWCVEAVLERLRGVASVVSGYAGGHVEYPMYEEVCGKRTGHAEVVRVAFDPSVLSYEDLLRVFFTTHDPTTRDRQGADVGPQYRSVVYTESDAQAAAAVRVRDEIEASGVWGRPLVTDIAPLDVFYEAEAYHQGYYRRNPFQGYCAAVIAPKVSKLRRQYAHLLQA